MIKISNTVIKKQNNFWNCALFHPTDAIEDPWGKRILDRLAEDKCIHTVRIYTMFEDIVYIDESGNLQYDFRLSDLRLDYLTQNGFDILLAYGGMPDCIADSTANKTSVSKNKTRYKGKLWNTSPPSDYSLWEEVCYEYTKHNVERYGIETVSRWHCQCFNEPDLHIFFLSQVPEKEVEVRAGEYCKLYEAFQKGIRRVSERINIGGPALAYVIPFLGNFLDYVKENKLKLDFISMHSYGTSPDLLNSKSRPFCVDSLMNKFNNYFETVRDHGFADTPIIIDEWGMSSHGFYNREECPDLIARETEVFSAYFAKLIHRIVNSELKMEKLMICLSGQHEMVEDFSGFRNFFTLNFITKPIYNAYILSSKLKEYVLQAQTENENLFVLPTKDENNNISVMLSYSAPNFEEELAGIEETIDFKDYISGKKVTVWSIDKEHTNPYRLYQKMGIETPSAKELDLLREEGRLKPIMEYIAQKDNKLTLKLTANSIFLITVV